MKDLFYMSCWILIIVLCQLLSDYRGERCVSAGGVWHSEPWYTKDWCDWSQAKVRALRRDNP